MKDGIRLVPPMLLGKSHSYHKPIKYAWNKNPNCSFPRTKKEVKERKEDHR